jgi:hypothetical protein
VQRRLEDSCLTVGAIGFEPFQGGLRGYYLDEFTFRFNRRTSRSRGMLFYRLIQQAAVAGPVTYTDIRDNLPNQQPLHAIPQRVELNG